MIFTFALILAPSLFVPGHTGYLIDSKADRSEGETLKLDGPRAKVLWGGYVSAGDLAISVRKQGGKAGSLTVDGNRLHVRMKGNQGAVLLKQSGWVKISYSDPGATVTGLDLSGKATIDAKFNMKTRLNCASVHIGYPQAAGKNIDWFYNEIKAKTDPVATYYMACGFARGYFGMQVNSTTERRVIFSVWDSGNEAIDRKKVGRDDLVRLLIKGSGVFADSFGNEGTGGHSHLVTNWETNKTQRFLVHAEKQEEATIYTGYFYSEADKQWNLIASFRAPKDGKLLRGLYSFNENFWGDNGYLKREAEFGTAWIHTADGGWSQLTTGRFTHDGTGGKDRFDYDLTARGSKWLLQNGGFEGSSPKLGTLVEVKKGSMPETLAKLPK